MFGPAVCVRRQHRPEHAGHLRPLVRAEPDVLIKELAGDEAIKPADTLLLMIPNQLGVDYNAHVLESILKYVAPELGWR